MNGEQPISTHDGIRIRYEGGGGGNNSVPEVSVGPLPSHMFINLTICNSKISEVDTGEASIPVPQYTVCDDEDSMSDMVMTPDRWQKGPRLTMYFVA